MTSAAGRRAAGESRWLLLATGLPAAAIIVVWLACSSRGLDFTDEAYALLHYGHWREFVANASFFGWVLEWPFRAVGGSVAGIRVVGLLLMLSAGAFAAWQLVRWLQGPAADAWPFVITGALGSMYLFVQFATLRVPAYNHLTLAAGLASLGWLLRICRPEIGRGSRRGSAFALGVLTAAGAAVKAPAALALSLLLLCLLVLFRPRLAWREWLILVGSWLAGTGLVLGLLQWSHPGWLDMVQTALRVGRELESRHFGLMLRTLWWDLQRSVLAGAWMAVAALAAWAGWVRLAAGRDSSGLAWPVAVLVCASALVWGGVTTSRAWWPTLVAAVLGLWAVGPLRGRSWPLAADELRFLLLLMILVLMPFAFSIGTNVPLLVHARGAMAFGVLALIAVLVRLQRAGALSTAATGVCLLAVQWPVASSQWASLHDAGSTYRLRAGLLEQRVVTAVGPAGAAVRLDAETAAGLERVRQCLERAGFRPGMPLIDLSGDNPGIVFAVGGTPLGVAWLIGGYPGSEAATRSILRTVPSQRLEQAWLLSAGDNPRAVPHGPALLGGDALEHVGTLVYRPQYSWAGGPVPSLALEVWRPRSLPGSRC